MPSLIFDKEGNFDNHVTEVEIDFSMSDGKVFNVTSSIFLLLTCMIIVSEDLENWLYPAPSCRCLIWNPDSLRTEAEWPCPFDDRSDL